MEAWNVGVAIGNVILAILALIGLIWMMRRLFMRVVAHKEKK